MEINGLLKNLGVGRSHFHSSGVVITSPIDGKEITRINNDSLPEIEIKIRKSKDAFEIWKDVPAPKRGDLIRIFGDELRKQKENLGRLVTVESGKINAEGFGEVQEMIDICDFSVGLSRQLYGLTMPSERKLHSIQECWLPLGPVAVISAFNFPVAVWAWNFTLAIICGNSVLWKPSEKTPLTALACQAIFKKACARYMKGGGLFHADLSQVIMGGSEAGAKLVSHPSVALVSATGSTAMGKIVGPRVAERFGRSLLELGGNNAVIVSEKAQIDLALNGIIFGAVGTAGQRCTTTRRVFVHNTIAHKFFENLKRHYSIIGKKRVGNPFERATLVGPLIDQRSFEKMQAALLAAKEQGGKIFFGKRLFQKKLPKAFYVQPALVWMPNQTQVVKLETFAPILYVMKYTNLTEALKLHNDVPQGLSSSIFTTDLREADYFRRTSDCGIANVNIGTSGAEIGGAFGGEKETGGGRESGSDAWKNYMRRQTSTLYNGSEKPALAQGLTFDVG